jgi:hypothetical protein
MPLVQHLVCCGRFVAVGWEPVPLPGDDLHPSHPQNKLLCLPGSVHLSFGWWTSLGTHRACDLFDPCGRDPTVARHSS